MQQSKKESKINRQHQSCNSQCKLQHFKQGNIIMMLKSLKFSNLIARHLRIFTNLKTKAWKAVQTPSFLRMFLVGSGVTLSMGCVLAIEDNAIKNLRSLLDKQISSLRNEYGQTTVYPQIKYELRGNEYEIMFEIDQRKCDLFILISTFMNTYQTDKTFKVIDMKAYTNPKNNLTTFYVEFEENDPTFKTPQRGRLTLIGMMTQERPSFRLIFNKTDLITEKNQKALAAVYKEAVKPKKQNISTHEPASGFPNKNAPMKKKKGNELINKLTEMGLTVFDPNDKTVTLDWDCLAGYENQKRLIEDTVLLALNYPEIYDEITYEPNRPKAVLFEGPPGTGKTTSAKIISQQVNIPLIYIPTEAIMSKFYGESETRLAQMWSVCEQMGKVIIFIDEIDALAGNRNTDMHEASRRILSTLLRKIDSFESSTNVLLICATNRKVDLDPAMLSRIDLSVNFSLPDKHSRAAIFQRYAKHLSNKELQLLASKTDDFSGRNISDICKNAERRWASRFIRGETTEKIPNLEAYLISLEERRANQLA